MIPVSPFLHRDERPRRHLSTPVLTYAERIIPSPEQQRGTIEKFRYNWYVRNGTLGRFLQQLGDWGRSHFPFIGHGWDGFGPLK